MRNLIYIFLLLPLLVWGQTIPDKKYNVGVEISKTYHGGVVVWSSCTPDINERATTSNATSDPNCNESAATTGWAVSRSTLAVENTIVHTGSHSLKITANVDSSGTSYAYYVFSGTSGQVVTISFWYYSPVSNSANTGIQHFGVAPNGYATGLTEGEWTYHETTTTLGAGGTYWARVFVDDTVGPSGDENELYIDDMGIN